jgi:hypothetical protein
MAPARQQKSSECSEVQVQTVDPNADLVRRIKEAADKWSFVAQNLGLKWRKDAARSKMV